MSVYTTHDDPGLNRWWATGHVGAKSYRCSVAACDRTSVGEQAPQCLDHPYREMEENR